MNLNFLLNRCEFAHPNKYDGRNELIFAVFACFAWFIAVILRLSLEGYDGWTTLDKAIEASSTVVFCGPVFFLATPLGSKVTRDLSKRDGIKFQILACTLLLAYISLVKFLELSPDKFIWLEQMSNLVLKDKFWINTALFITGAFVVLRIPFLMLRLRKVASEIRGYGDLIAVFRQNFELSVLLIVNFIYMILSHTSLVFSNSSNNFEGYYIGIGYFIIFFLMNLSVFKRTSSSKLMVFDLFLTIACLGVLFWFSMPFFSFGTFIGVNLFVTVVIHGLGLGREHFGYSFQVRKQDANYFISTLPLIVLTLVPLALAFKFVEPSNLLGSRPEILKLATYSILFSFRVGIFEEVFVRSGLMVFLRDQLSERTLKKNNQQLVFCSAVGCSVVFGLSHINNPATGSLLTPLEYKSVYVLLAFLASLFYSFAFGETNRLWCSITIHGFVDTVAVVLLGGFLTVPF